MERGLGSRAAHFPRTILAGMVARRVWLVSFGQKADAKIRILGRVFEDALTQAKFFDIILKDGAVPKW